MLTRAQLHSAIDEAYNEIDEHRYHAVHSRIVWLKGGGQLRFSAHLGKEMVGDDLRLIDDVCKVIEAWEAKRKDDENAPDDQVVAPAAGERAREAR
jgi:hypothetical protein